MLRAKKRGVQPFLQVNAPLLSTTMRKQMWKQQHHDGTAIGTAAEVFERTGAVVFLCVQSEQKWSNGAQNLSHAAFFSSSGVPGHPRQLMTSEALGVLKWREEDHEELETHRGCGLARLPLRGQLADSYRSTGGARGLSVCTFI
jgi:hypothetical protein